MSQKVLICTLGIGGWYPRGVARMIQQFNRVSPGYEIRAWVNTYPENAPGPMVVQGVDYGPYCAKPFALLNALAANATIAILLDAAFFPIRSIFPLVEHIAQRGYYFCDNGNNVGEWASDLALGALAVKRSDAYEMPEISSYCVGLNFTDERCKMLLSDWGELSYNRLIVPGSHTAIGHEGRNVGFVSLDPRVKGHRHDQTLLSILAHQRGMRELTPRPQFTAYRGSETDETVLINHGGDIE